MNVADAMTPRSEVITVEVPGTRDDVLEYLQDLGFSSVPVIKTTDDGEQFRGLVTRESLIENPDEDQLALLVREVPTLPPSASVTELAELILESNERRVPVVKDGALVGIVTVTDIVRAIAEGEQDGSTEVGKLATRVINTVYHETPLPVAERQLSYADVPYAVVLDDDGRQTGMLTEVDIIEVARVVRGESNKPGRRVDVGRDQGGRQQVDADAERRDTVCSNLGVHDEGPRDRSETPDGARSRTAHAVGRYRTDTVALR